MFNVYYEHGFLVIDMSTDFIQRHLHIRNKSAHLTLLAVEALLDTVDLCCVTSAFDTSCGLFHLQRLDVLFETCDAGLNGTYVAKQISLEFLALN